MDAFAVSLSEGLTIRQIHPKHILKIALTFGLFQAIMPFVGWSLGAIFSDKIIAYGNYIGGILLLCIGFKMIFDAFEEQKCDEDIKNSDDSETKSNILLLGIATSIDALAIGFSFSFVQNLNIISIIIEIGLITFIISGMGVYIGNKFGNILGYKATYFGGGLLILIGFKTLLLEFI
ncbi:MAG: manganese efflux pump MntP family protein [Cetobacterium sp.]